jgi:hypothetical protein
MSSPSRTYRLPGLYRFFNRVVDGLMILAGDRASQAAASGNRVALGVEGLEDRVVPTTTPSLSFDSATTSSIVGETDQYVLRVTGAYIPTATAPTGTATLVASAGLMGPTYTISTVNLVPVNSLQAIATFDVNTLPATMMGYSITITYN